MFLEDCRNMVIGNIFEPLDKKIIEIMQYVVVALVLTLGNMMYNITKEWFI